MPFAPGDPWPDTTYPGGAVADTWGGYTRIVVQAQIAAGKPFRLGPDPNDRLNSGNVMSQAGGLPLGAGPLAQPSGLWVDLTCDVTDLEISFAASSSTAGLLAKAEAGTLTATLYDPTGKYDPLNPTGPYSLGGQTRLVPGAPIRAFAEVVYAPRQTPPLVGRYALFTGTADRWQEDWVQHEGERFAKLTATDETKRFVKYDRPEQPPVGAGDNPLARLTRIATFFGWPGSVTQFGTSLQTLQATTLAQPGWEMVNRVADDELGIVVFPPQLPTATWAPGMVLYARSVWQSVPGTFMSIGCTPEGDPGTWYDIAVDAQPAAFDVLLRNTVYASRSGGTLQTVSSGSSVARYGEQSLQRSDLGLNDDTQVAAWAQELVLHGAFPHTVLDHVTLNPGIVPDSFAFGPFSAWLQVLQAHLVTSIIRVLWEGADYQADVLCRIVGWKHKVTVEAWEVTWITAPAETIPSAQTFTLGPHAQDRLDAGFLLGG